MVGVLGSNPSVDTKQISKSLEINNLEIFLFLFWRHFGVIIDFWRSLDPIFEVCNLRVYKWRDYQNFGILYSL